MKQIIELTEEDIIKTIANAYNVDINKVKLNIKKEWITQRDEVYKASATIILCRRSDIYDRNSFPKLSDL